MVVICGAGSTNISRTYEDRLTTDMKTWMVLQAAPASEDHHEDRHIYKEQHDQRESRRDEPGCQPDDDAHHQQTSQPVPQALHHLLLFPQPLGFIEHRLLGEPTDLTDGLSCPVGAELDIVDPLLLLLVRRPMRPDHKNEADDDHGSDH